MSMRLNWIHVIENCETCQTFIREQGYTRDELMIDFEFIHPEKLAAGE